MKMEIEPIGTVRSPIHEPVDEGWGEIVSEVHVGDWLIDGLRGLDSFSHAIIIFWMHEAQFDINKHLTRHPRGRVDLPESGIFAQRARHRPNPIGITTVEIISVAGNVLRVRGLDAIDGTPVLDIKPYVPAFDDVEDPTVPEWMNRIMKGYF